MVTWERQDDHLLLALLPEGVRFLREQWSWMRDLVRWQLTSCTDDPLAELVGLPVPTGPLDGRLAYVVDYWCGRSEPPPVRRVWEGWVLHDLQQSLDRVLASLPRLGGVVRLPAVGPEAPEWGWMLETLHVVLDVSGRVHTTVDPARRMPPAPSPEEAENYRRSLLWLESVLDALAQAERTAPAPADPTG